MAAAGRTATLPYAAWVGLSCLLYAVRSLPSGIGLISLAATVYVDLAIGFRGVIPAPDPLYFAILVPIVLGTAAPFAIDRLVAARWDNWLGTFLFPLAFVAVDFVNARLGPYATNGSIAYTQFDNLPLIQIASVTGMFGVTFILAWFASTVTWAIGRGPHWSATATPVVVYGVALALVLVGGDVRLASAAEAAFVARAQQVAREHGIYLAMGIAAIEPGAAKPFGNKLTVIAPSGEVLFSYRKSLPVPGWEERIMVRGDGRLPLASTDDGRVGGSICFEMDRPQFVRQVGRATADLWIVPANDWREVKRSHLQPVAFRAIENGTPIRRAGRGRSARNSCRRVRWPLMTQRGLRWLEVEFSFVSALCHISPEAPGQHRN
jgi:apolipoprotein N-acyltransferase